MAEWQKQKKNLSSSIGITLNGQKMEEQQEEGEEGAGMAERNGDLAMAQPERRITPMPHLKKGKRLRDSLRKRRAKEGVGGGEAAEKGTVELKVVNVNGGRMERRRGEGEENGGRVGGGEMGDGMNHHKEGAGGDEEEANMAKELSWLPATAYFDERDATMRATDFWEAKKCSQNGGKEEEEDIGATDCDGNGKGNNNAAGHCAHQVMTMPLAMAMTMSTRSI